MCSELSDRDVELGVRHGEAVLLLQGAHHAAEILSDEGAHELWAREALRATVLLENLVQQVGARCEGQRLGEDEGVVAVE